MAHGRPSQLVVPRFSFGRVGGPDARHCLGGLRVQSGLVCVAACFDTHIVNIMCFALAVAQ